MCRSAVTSEGELLYTDDEVDKRLDSVHSDLASVISIIDGLDLGKPFAWYAVGLDAFEARMCLGRAKVSIAILIKQLRDLKVRADSTHFETIHARLKYRLEQIVEQLRVVERQYFDWRKGRPNSDWIRNQ